LLKTLKSIHRADILHGDIRLPNICVTPPGQAVIVDFSHATENCSQKEKDREIQDLLHVLKMGLPTELAPTEPAAKDEKKPVVLRRSARIQARELERQLQKPGAK